MPVVWNKSRPLGFTRKLLSAWNTREINAEQNNRRLVHTLMMMSFKEKGREQHHLPATKPHFPV